MLMLKLAAIRFRRRDALMAKLVGLDAELELLRSDHARQQRVFGLTILQFRQACEAVDPSLKKVA